MEKTVNAAGNAAPFPIALVAIVIGVILMAGLIGGIAAFLTEKTTPAADGVKRAPSAEAWPRFILLGVIAAACVPLFLSLVKSELFNSMAGSDGKMGFEAVLIFTGLCLIAAFSARTFIDSISRRVLQQVEQVKERQNEIEKKTADKAKETDQKVETLEERVDDREAEPVPLEERTAGAAHPEDALPAVGAEEQRVLNAVAAKVYRTVTGITEDSEMERGHAKTVLQSLLKKGLIEPTVSSSGGLRWHVTALGKAAVKPS